MKNILFLIAVIGLPIQICAQTCVPDTTVVDSITGVYPQPITPENPDGGIDLPACPGEYYEYTLTVIIPDTATINVSGFPVHVDIISAQIAEEGAVQGLPPGIDYLCMPEDCIFPDKNTGCVLLFGTVEDGTPPGEYELSIALQITLEGIGTIDVDFPGPQFPGEYYLEVADSTSSICLSSAPNILKNGKTFYPNPISSEHLLHVANAQSIEWLDIHSIGGHKIKHFSRIPETISLKGYTSGLYLLNYRINGQFHYQKLIVRE